MSVLVSLLMVGDAFASDVCVGSQSNDTEGTTVGWMMTPGLSNMFFWALLTGSHLFTLIHGNFR